MPMRSCCAPRALSSRSCRSSPRISPNLKSDLLMARPKVALTNPSVPVGENLIKEVADLVTAPDVKPDTLRALAADCEVLIVRTKLPDDIFERPHRLKGVVRHGAGVDMIPMESATKLGIPVANVPGANAQTVAEHVITTMLMLARATHRMDALVR